MDCFDTLTHAIIILISMVLTFGFGPIGVVRLFPLFDDKRQLWSGLLFTGLGIVGAISFITLLSPRW